MNKILFAIVGMAVAVISENPMHPLCANNNSLVVGSSLLAETLFLFVLDDVHKQTLVYLIPASNVKPVHGKIVVDHNIQKRTVAEIWNYDPYSQDKIPINIFVINGPRLEETIITFIFDETYTHAESVSSFNKERADSLSLNSTRNVIIWNDEYRGLHFFKVISSNAWFARDISYFGNEFWFKKEIFAVAKTDEEILYKSSGPSADESFVNWTRLNGFIYDNVNVFLFTDQEVYYFIDPFDEHKGSQFNFKYKRSSYDQVFWCNGELPKIYFEPIAMIKSSGNKRAHTIYVLFALHFVVAFAMLGFIINVNLFDHSHNNNSKLEQNSKKRKTVKSKSKKSHNSQISNKVQVQSKNF